MKEKEMGKIDRRWVRKRGRLAEKGEEGRSKAGEGMPSIPHIPIYITLQLSITTI